ncbi:MAG: AzlD domain-containing protein [Bdellovibrionales bacterium]
MDPVYFYKAIIPLAIGTYLIRLSFIAFSDRIQLNERTRRILSFIPVAVLPALIAPMAFFHKGGVDLFWGKERFVAMLLATIVCFYTRNMLYTLVSGLAILFLFQNFL